MKSVEVKGSLRETVGKTTSKSLRRQEQVPCVLYGNGSNVHFHLHENSFKNIVFTPNAYLINIDIEGKKYQTVLRDVQFHPVTDKIIHADFFQVEENNPVWVEVPVILEGTSKGVLNGGRLVQKMRKVKVKAAPVILPDEVKVDITNLGIGQSIKVGNLNLEGIEFLENANSVLVLVKTARNASAAEVAADGKQKEEAPAEGAAETKEAAN